MEGPDWSEIRRRFPAAVRRPYLDTALKGLPAPETLAAVADYCRFAAEAPGRSAMDDSLLLIEGLEEARREAAALVGAEPAEVALVEGTQHGLSIAAGALRLRRGDHVVTDDLEFFAVALPWLSLAREGVETTVVPSRDGQVEVADLEAALTPRTRVVAVSSVQETNGFLLDLDALAAVCRARGVVLVVDGTQHVGPLPLDVRATPVDVLAVGPQKWLCSPFGVGFLYVRAGLLASLEPPVRGYMGLATPPGGWDAYLADPERRIGDPLAFVEDARKLEVGGTGPYAGAAALAAAIRFLRATGPAAVHARVGALVEALVTGLGRAGLEVTSPPGPARRSGIVSFRTGRGLAEDRRVHGRLLDAGISVSLRFAAGTGGIRVAPYLYTDEGDVAALLDTVGAALT